MSNEEAQKVLNELQSVRPEMLNRKAKRLFEAIMKIADERDSLRKIVERQNLEIMAQKDAHDFDTEIANETINKQNELIEYLRRSCDRKESSWIEEQQENVELETKLEEKDKIINAMAEYISKKEILVDKHCYALTAEAVKQWFEKQIK
mgnify:FL=1